METKFLQDLGLNEEQIKSVFAENGKDLNAAKTQVAELTATNVQLTAAKAAAEANLTNVQNQLNGFKDVNVDDLKGQISTLTQTLETERKAREKDNLLHDLEKSVDTFMGDKAFVNDITKNAIRQNLLTELDKDTAKGKSISDIFNSIVNGEDGKPLPNILVDNEQQGNSAMFTGAPLGGMPKPGANLTTEDLMKLKNQYPDLDISQYLKKK